jgi:hypothetical protein
MYDRPGFMLSWSLFELGLFSSRASTSTQRSLDQDDRVGSQFEPGDRCHWEELPYGDTKEGNFGYQPSSEQRTSVGLSGPDILGCWATTGLLGIGWVLFNGSVLHEPPSRFVGQATSVSNLT